MLFFRKNLSPTQNLEDRINRFQYAQEFWHHDFITEGKDTLLGAEGNQGRLGLRQLSGTSLQMELQVMLQSLCEACVGPVIPQLLSVRRYLHSFPGKDWLLSPSSPPCVQC